MHRLAIEGAWEVSPRIHRDDRGRFLEWYRADGLEDAAGRGFRLAQANMSVSARGVIRGIHFADAPPGQAKYVTCVRGAVFDVIVDIRVGSPTFGQWTGVELDDTAHRAVLISEGLGHGFCALTPDACVAYLCSTPYAPEREHTVHALDPALGIDWPAADPVLSPRDEAAPTLAEARAARLLPEHGTVRDWTTSLSVRQEH
ncbi:MULTISPECIES: dTDP-4-dehydrorhamnose 3,5-epimerase [unclassified Streptomyces]|uniref:dTDP-4-dehydrorhamnose 3,5-epimerase n=1 Tax=unclassified Streptomyces TaxID=2593676 RepID=UPI00340DC550